MLALGMCAGVVYDVIRVLRRVVPHGSIAIQLEDMIYWLLFTLCAMMVLLWEDNGTFRIFSALAPVLGLAFYFAAFSRFCVVPILFTARALKTLWMAILRIFCLPLKLFVRLIEFPLKKIKKILYKFNKIAKIHLKKTLKCAKIKDGLLCRVKNGKK